MVKQIIKLIYWVVVLTTLIACQNQDEVAPQLLTFSGLDKVTNNNLGEIITDYYKSENDLDWKITYQYRPASYKKLVPFEMYEKSMEEDMSGWQLLKVEIVDIEKENDPTVRVKIRFSELFDSKVAKKKFDGRVSQGMNRRSEETIWKKEANSWIAVQPGQRGHLPLNDRLVY